MIFELIYKQKNLNDRIVIEIIPKNQNLTNISILKVKQLFYSLIVAKICILIIHINSSIDKNYFKSQIRAIKITWILMLLQI